MHGKSWSNLNKEQGLSYPLRGLLSLTEYPWVKNINETHILVINLKSMRNFELTEVGNK